VSGFSKFKLFNLLTPRSHCPQCENLIPIWCNIPVISFLIQKGKCLDCGLAISWRYPAVELLTCFASICVAHKFGFSVQTLAALVLTWSLIAATFIDFEHQLIPDSISIPLIWLGLLLNTWQLFTTPEKAIIGAILAYLTLWLVAYVYRLIRKTDGMGNGDFKLFAVFGAWFGWEYLPLILLLASVIGTLVAIVLLLKKQATLKSAIAFGPYLAIAGWVIMFWGHTILQIINSVVA